MKKQIFIILLLTASFIFLLQSCSKSESIELNDIKYTPEYFHNKMLFGKDAKSLTELNKYKIVTGLIDTNSEQQPIEVAYISIKKALVELRKVSRTQSRPQEVFEEYSGSGFRILIKYNPEIIGGSDSFTTGSCTIDSGSHTFTLPIVGKKGFG